jgi:hypothetical protein
MCISDTHVRYNMLFKDLVADCMAAFSWPVMVNYQKREGENNFVVPLTNGDLVGLSYDINRSLRDEKQQREYEAKMTMSV